MHTVSLVCYDTRNEDIKLVIGNVLDNLFKSTDHIFSEAEQRVKQCQDRLNSYKQRFEVIQKKLETLNEVIMLLLFISF